jgi:hypothetical protein
LTREATEGAGRSCVSVLRPLQPSPTPLPDAPLQRHAAVSCVRALRGTPVGLQERDALRAVREKRERERKAGRYGRYVRAVCSAVAAPAAGSPCRPHIHTRNLSLLCACVGSPHTSGASTPTVAALRSAAPAARASAGSASADRTTSSSRYEVLRV